MRPRGHREHRANPRVCLELDSIQRQDEWTSIVVLGRFEELNDSPAFQSARVRALALLQRRAMWWEPGAIDPSSRAARRDAAPVVFRICVECLSGRRGVPAAREAAPASSATNGAVRATV